MLLIPAIDIKDGHCVRLRQGDLTSNITVFNTDPVAQARHWVELGAERLHLVDLDAARSGKPVNLSVIRKICNEFAEDVEIEVGGGMRTLERVGEVLDLGVDYVVMPQWKLFLVQLLNIAGLGPIFGALQGALWGPVVFLWITFGTIFAGGVHDYFSGMMSERNDGASIAEVTGRYLGPVMQNIMRVFSVVLLIMVGTVFAVGPAGLIVTLCKNGGMSGVMTTTLFWLIIILVYYFIAAICTPLTLLSGASCSSPLPVVLSPVSIPPSRL